LSEKKKPNANDKKQKNTTPEQSAELTCSLENNISLFKELFSDVDPMMYREIDGGENGEFHFCLIFSDGVTSAQRIDEYIIKPLTLVRDLPEKPEQILDYLMKRVLFINGVQKTNELKSIIEAISYGDTVLLVNNSSEAILLDSKYFLTRAIAEPDGEKILSGPREGFTEALMTNLSMLRRRMRSSDLKMKFLTLGKQTNTSICVAYMDNIVDKKILDELYRRLNEINIDGILDANYIDELIQDNKWSLFRSSGYTERPDVIAGKILEGRIAIFVDGTPVVLTVPHLFIENFQTNEDYYLSFYYTSFTRLMRIAGFFMSIIVPALYIAIIAYHQEMLPTTLMTSIAIDSNNVPMPEPVEALLLLIMFDILRETGIRMPSRVGQAMSIVGALVVGQAAVEARLVAAPMIIIVAVTGISSLLVSKMNAPTIIIRSAILLFASCFGFLGVTLGLAILLIHILNLKSFGVSQMTRDNPFGTQENKDIFVRAPWRNMTKRPYFLTDNKTRLKKGGVS